MTYIIDSIKKSKYLIVAILIVLIAYIIYIYINREVDENPLEEGSNINFTETISLEEQKKALDEEFKKVSPPTKEELEKQKQELQELKNNL